MRRNRYDDIVLLLDPGPGLDDLSIISHQPETAARYPVLGGGEGLILAQPCFGDINA